MACNEHNASELVTLKSVEILSMCILGTKCSQNKEQGKSIVNLNQPKGRKGTDVVQVEEIGMSQNRLDEALHVRLCFLIC